jgi:hypothetical protein
MLFGGVVRLAECGVHLVKLNREAAALRRQPDACLCTFGPTIDRLNRKFEVLMTSVEISISENQARRLQALSERVGLSIEELLRGRMDQFLDRTESEFETAADYVLRKNAELYRRLA